MGSNVRDRWEAAAVRGFSLVEVLISTVVIAVALLASAGTLGTTLRLSRVVSERDVAQRAATAVLQDVASVEFAKVLASYDADPSNDPGGAGKAPGAKFAVAGLNPPAGVNPDAVGEVVFPLAGTAVREDLVLPELGMPRDLNGDGRIDGADHAADCRLLPVLVRVRWQGVEGKHASLSLTRLLCER